ncbi:MAG: amidohydrolase [Defluviitaleaceae bacterium]|nr:amidohydrolase [Defluviitaleaceae bacterium]
MEILFKNITAVTMADTQQVLQNANIGVKDGKIIFVADNELEKASKTAARTIDGLYKVLIPGLYNCHTHSPMSLLRGFANDLALEEWLFDNIFPAEGKIKGLKNAVYTGTMLAIAEMVASGTVAFSDMYFNLPEIARAVDETGVKANLSNAVISFAEDGYIFADSPECAETLEILQGYHKASHGRIKIGVSCHCAYTTHPTAWRQTADFSQKHGLSMHVHLSETITEHNKALEQFNATPTECFAKHGVFDTPTTAAHACWVSEDDIEILAKYGVSVAHNPISNLKLASGIAPITAMQKKGVNVALGTDGMASNNSHDLFEEIKIASILQKCATEDPTATPAIAALKMATVNGAKAQGRQGGTIQPGNDADLVLLDFRNPRQMPYNPSNPIVNLAYSTTGRDVVMTLCQGKILYENGEFTSLDIEKILFEVDKVVAAIG